MPLHDFTCGRCQTLHKDVFFRNSPDGIMVELCSHCGGELDVTFEQRRPRLSGDGSFVPFDYEGIHFLDRTSWEGYKKDIETNNPGMHLEEVSHNSKRARQRADDIRHRQSIFRRNRHGINDYEWRRQLEARVRKAKGR